MRYENSPNKCPNFKRPNRERVKTTVYLGPEDRERIERIRRKRACTAAAAVRWAIAEATKDPPPPPETTRIGYAILKWAEGLFFLTDRERRMVRDFARQLYELEANHGKHAD